ncbi:hypothetical protein CRG98_033454 [Punica granatum]|uniref:Uncharacterized protein n=1 Tax=Punica granatum TaxID=22663 RepID=A0A2I0IRX3_PUNGR|nr:hypothetical protein CRG98_033454 [Punica granatum]
MLRRSGSGTEEGLCDGERRGLRSALRWRRRRGFQMSSKLREREAELELLQVGDSSFGQKVSAGLLIGVMLSGPSLSPKSEDELMCRLRPPHTISAAAIFVPAMLCFLGWSPSSVVCSARLRSSLSLSLYRTVRSRG